MSKMTNSTLGAVAKIITGPFGSQLHQSDYVEYGHPLIMPQNIGDRILDYNKMAYISDEDAARLSRYKAMPNDIVYSRRGDVGKHAFITDDKAYCGTGCFLVRFNSTEVEPSYVSYYLNTPESKQWLVLNAVGSNMMNLNTEILKAVPIRYPNIKEQRSIVAVLNSLDRKIALNKTIAVELEKAAKLLYDYWFVQFDFPDEKSKPYRTSGGSMEYNEQLKREIPKGWNSHRLDEKLNIQRGVEPGSDAYSDTKTETETVPFIRVSDLGSTPSLFISVEAANGTYCDVTDVLVSFDGSIGKMSIAMEGAYSSGVRKITAKDDGYSDALIYFIFQSEEIQKTIAKYAVGSNILHASGAIEHLLFPYDSKVVREFIIRIEPMYQRIVANHQQNKELVALRDFLLPLLMNGQVRVHG